MLSPSRFTFATRTVGESVMVVAACRLRGRKSTIKNEISEPRREHMSDSVRRTSEILLPPLRRRLHLRDPRHFCPFVDVVWDRSASSGPQLLTEPGELFLLRGCEPRERFHHRHPLSPGALLDQLSPFARQVDGERATASTS